MQTEIHVSMLNDKDKYKIDYFIVRPEKNADIRVSSRHMKVVQDEFKDVFTSMSYFKKNILITGKRGNQAISSGPESCGICATNAIQRQIRQTSKNPKQALAHYITILDATTRYQNLELG